MDTSELIIDYTESDFSGAIRSLLPKGQYWQEADNLELTQLIQAMAIDFKATHDDIELSLLTELKESLFGWKISDYQALLFDVSGTESGTVYDDVATPNLIYVSLNSSARKTAGEAWKAFEEKRLPHTDIKWLYINETTLFQQVANYQYSQNFHEYEVCQTLETYSEFANARHILNVTAHEVT